jgi:2-dehydropantoate 2-reductase
MRITIVGAGAIGGICGAYLTKAGRDVTLIEPYEPHRERIRAGVFIDGARGEMTVPLNAISWEELDGSLELVLVAVKTTRTRAAIESLRPHVGPDTLIVTLLNGISEDAIASAFGAERVMGCVVGWGATNTAAGHLTQTSEGKFTLGELDGRMTERLDTVKGVLDDIVETLLTDNLYGHRWSKLSINCLIAGCATLGLTVGEALAPERNKLVFIRLIREVIETAEACGVTVEKFEGVVDPTTFKATDDDGVQRCIQILDMMAAIAGDIYPGPLQDIERGLETEADYITGCCVDRARETSVAVPINTKVRQILKQMEAGEITPSPENIALLESVAGKT